MNSFKDLNEGKGLLKTGYGATEDTKSKVMEDKLRKKRKKMMENRGMTTEEDTQED